MPDSSMTEKLTLLMIANLTQGVLLLINQQLLVTPAAIDENRNQLIEWERQTLKSMSLVRAAASDFNDVESLNKAAESINDMFPSK